jgi:glycosyltransferase involved in cell wall biosynthesis
MEVSVVIPTYNGEHKISHLLDALLKQTLQNFEIVVVIDGSTDCTEKILDKYERRFYRFKKIKQPNSGRSIVRNQGSKHAGGDLLIFYDDDMIPLPDSISQHLRFHTLNPKKSLLSGNQIENFSRQQCDIQNYKAFLSKKWLSPFQPGISALSVENLFFSAANCSIKRRDFEFLNGFDERLTDAEDHDLALRALKKGMEVFFDKDNVAIHNDKISAASYLKRLRAYHIAHIKLSRIHQMPLPQKSKHLHKEFVYRFFAFKFWVKLIDSDILKYMLPSAMRFKMYDLIFQSLSVEHPNSELN